jgi:putative DNA methylase
MWPDPADESCPASFRETAERLMHEWAAHSFQLSGEESLKRFVAIEKNPELLQDPVQLRGALLDFISDFADWDNATVEGYLRTARALTAAAHEALGGAPGTRPLFVDPFAGGGAMPLEALRIGGDAFASDLNPVAVLLNKVILEYAPKYGKHLAREVRRVAAEVMRDVLPLVDEYYPPEPDGTIPVAYLWARTAACEGPGCGAEIPLYRSPLLAQRGSLRTFLRARIDTSSKQISFEIEEAKDLTKTGTVQRGAALCPVCGYTTSAANVRRQFLHRHGGANDARLLAVVTLSPKGGRKFYRAATARDLVSVRKASGELAANVEAHEGDLALVPDEELPYLRSIFNIQLLGVHRWGDLFTDRQLLILTALWQRVREQLNGADEHEDTELAIAVTACVALAIDRLSAQFTSLAWWQPKGEFAVGTFGRQALGIIWDFVEIRPIDGASGDLNGAVEWVGRVLEEVIDEGAPPGQAEVVSATALPLPDDSATMLVTDPPYYDAVPYADLSDFFYVQLRRMLATRYQDLFALELTEKDGEIVQLAERNPKYRYKTREYFERLMGQALAEGRRVLAPGGVGVIVFAHTTTEGWEALVGALIDSGWVVTGSWPIDTERAVRMRAQKSAALGSSIHLVCRPRENADGSLRTADIGEWRSVLNELPERIHQWMPRLANEGVVGADAIFACLGPALEIFSRYSAVEKASGEAVALSEYLEEVWAAVSREAMSMIFQGADASGLEEDARLTAMWLWTLHTSANGDAPADEEAKALRGYTLEYDAARKIAQGLGAHLENLNHLVEVKGDAATLLTAGARTRYLFGKDGSDAPAQRRKKQEQMRLDFAEELGKLEEQSGDRGSGLSASPGKTMLDRLHQAMILFGAGRGEAVRRFLVEDGVGQDSSFWSLAQALSALYPAGTDEKRWVDGILARKKGLGF